MARNANTAITYDGPSRGYGTARLVADGIFTFPAATVAANSAFTLFVIPRGQRILALTGRVDDADSNGAPTVVFSIGDAGNLSRYVANSIVAQTGGAMPALAAALVGTVTTADTPIILTINTAAATQTAGAQIYAAIEYVEA